MQFGLAFLCLFGVTFGVLWEILEFAVDRIWPQFDMQSTGTGVADTMKDLIVDTVGAVVVALMGYAYLKTGRYSFIADGVRRVPAQKPRTLRTEAAFVELRITSLPRLARSRARSGQGR